MDVYLNACTQLRDAFITFIASPAALHKRLRTMGHAQFLTWVREHTDEINALISSPTPEDQLKDSPRADMLCYGTAFVCNLARQMLDQYRAQALPVHGATNEVVADMGMRLLALCSCKPAPWPWASEHPFAKS